MWRDASINSRGGFINQMECKKSNGVVWKVMACVGLTLLTASVLFNLHDIKRYIRITTM